MKSMEKEQDKIAEQEEFEDGYDDEDAIRECSNSCAHYDSLNCCCWQSGPWGLYIEVSEGDVCHFNYRENSYE